MAISCCYKRSSMYHDQVPTSVHSSHSICSFTFKKHQSVLLNKLCELILVSTTFEIFIVKPVYSNLEFGVNTLTTDFTSASRRDFSEVWLHPTSLKLGKPPSFKSGRFSIISHLLGPNEHLPTSIRTRVFNTCQHHNGQYPQKKRICGTLLRESFALDHRESV